MQELVVRAYPAQAALAVRRLTDPRSRKPQRGVISLVSILQEIKDHGATVTRETYVTQGGLPYDPEPVDLLSAVAPANRRPTDVPSPKAIAILLRTCGYDQKAWIGPVRQLRNAADKAAAHAADGWSRHMPDEAPLTVVYRTIIEVHARLFAVHKLLFRFLRDGDIVVPPAMTLDPLAHVELGGFTESDRRRLRQIARGIEARYDRLAHAALADLEADLARLQGS